MKEFILKNLDCVDCAYRIEENVKKMEGVRFVSVNFATSRLKVDGDDLDRVIDIIKRIEPEIEFESLDNDENGYRTGDEYRPKIKYLTLNAVLTIVIPVILFGAGLILKYYLKLGGTGISSPSNYPFIVAYLVSGGPVFRNAGKKIFNLVGGKACLMTIFDENFLMTIATMGAFFIDAVPEAAGVMIFYRIGEYFQSISINRSRRSIKHLLDLQPRYANLIIGGEFRRVKPENVKIGGEIIVKPGEKIPLDGKVIEGTSTIDTSPITGESLPRPVGPYEEVYAGTINQGGVLKIRVIRDYKGSSVSRILTLVEDALEKKSKSEKFITRFSYYYTPSVVIAAFIIAVIPLIFPQLGSFRDWLYKALVMLVISCPCAFVISIPLSYFGGIGRASEEGVQIKGSNFMDILGKTGVVVFDKTGTLTSGNFKVTNVIPSNGISREKLIRWAGILETMSNHPIARSIVSYAEEIGVELSNIKDRVFNFKEVKGAGLIGEVDGKRVICGRQNFLKEQGVDVPVSGDSEFGTSVDVALENKYMGKIVLSDRVKDDAKATVKKLRNMGVRRIGMLTGDREEVASSVSSFLGLDFYFSELKPEEKVKVLESVIKGNPGKKVVFVGDGINDAPVLARADVGIAIGTYGNDAAMEAADIVLMSGRLLKIPVSIEIAKKTRRIVLQNIILSIVVKFGFLALGGMGLATMWEAVFGDVGVSLIAIMNALRVLYGKIPDGRIKK